jgi:RNA polymerase sigma-70 factor (ECF subfamily)
MIETDLKEHPPSQIGSLAQLEPEILAQNAQNNPQSFAVLFDRYYSRVFNYTRYRCEDTQTAEDLTSLVFERLLQKIHQYSVARGPFEPWLFAIARNIVKDHHRSPKARSREYSSGLSWEEFQPEVLFRHSPAGDSSPESLVISRENQAELLRALESLDERSRDLIGLKFAARLTNRQIAELTKRKYSSAMSESNVGVILYRAIARLRQILQESAPGADDGRRQR